MFKIGVILAGGEGTRMRPITNYLPKALVGVNGKPLIAYPIELLDLWGVDNVFVTYNYLSNKLFEHLSNSVDGFINTTNCDNSYFLFHSFIKDVNQPIIVMPCDVIADIDLIALYKDYERHNCPAIMMVGTRPVEGVVGDYITYDEYYRIESLSRAVISPLYASGIQVINPKKLNELCKDEENFNDVWSQLLGTNNLKISTIHPKSWMAYDNINQII
jgi:NDP-sugar pyrophosphorylase family protein